MVHSANEDAFVRHCCELLAAAGACRARRLFGGFGISVDGLTFALVAWDTLYLKADAASAPRFEAAGCRPFVYTARGSSVRLGYFSAPDEALDSPQLMAPWALQALDCALKAAAGRRARARPNRASPANTTRPATSRPLAPAPRAAARRRSSSG